MTRSLTTAGVLAAAVALHAPRAGAEAHFALANQYTRCTTCHYSTTGGGLLTEYGRMLSRQEVSTWGRSAPGTEPTGFREEAPFYDAFGKALGALDLGLDLRPSNLHFDIAGIESERSFWMRADLEAAYRTGNWTFFGEFGRDRKSVV